MSMSMRVKWFFSRIGAGFKKAIYGLPKLKVAGSNPVSRSRKSKTYMQQRVSLFLFCDSFATDRVYGVYGVYAKKRGQKTILSGWLLLWGGRAVMKHLA